MKRRLLEAKANKLEEMVLQCQDLVLQLGYYGNPKDTKAHIQRVKSLKARIELNFSK